MPYLRARTMRTLFVIFVLALTTIAFEIYSDPQPTTATTAIADALKHENATIGERR
jgi:hypothetical protein